MFHSAEAAGEAKAPASARALVPRRTFFILLSLFEVCARVFGLMAASTAPISQTRLFFGLAGNVVLQATPVVNGWGVATEDPRRDRCSFATGRCTLWLNRFVTLGLREH
jgi:hypothetical protein